MANEPTQTPASPAIEIGFGGNTISCMIRENQSEDDSSELEYIKDESGNDSVAVISNKGKRLTVDGVLKADQAAPAKGSTVSVGSTAYLVESCNVRRTTKAARISMTLYKPNATTWTAS